jgi:uncharacterized protein DUF4431
MQRGVVALIASLAMPQAHAAGCWTADRVETAAGRLTVGRFLDAADRPERAFILTLAVPACLTDVTIGDVREARTVHVFATDAAIQQRLKRHVGARVVVRGEPFASHTAHHHASIVMKVTGIELR